MLELFKVFMKKKVNKRASNCVAAITMPTNRIISLLDAQKS